MQALPHRVVAGCFAGLREEALVAPALARVAAMTRVEDRRALVRVVARCRPSIVMLPSVDAAGLSTAPVALQCADVAPNAVVIVIVATALRRREIARAGRAGAMLLCVETPAELRRGIIETLSRPRLSTDQLATMRCALAPFCEPLLAEVLLEAATHTDHCLSVHELACELTMSHRTLSRRLAAAHLPTACELIAWGRLLYLAVTARRGESIDSALARIAGAGGAAALRRVYATLLDDRDSASDPTTVTIGAALAALRGRIASLGANTPTAPCDQRRAAPARALRLLH